MSYLPVVETFHSLQGEGYHTGRSAFFIRLGGCKVGCLWCDTKHSWVSNLHAQRDVEDLAAEATTTREAGASFVVITGGEPLHHNLNPLCRALRHAASISAPSSALPIHLETSGVDILSGELDWITLSPKRHAPPRRDILACCSELKVVIHTAVDLEFAEAMAREALHNRESTSSAPKLILQPGWNCLEGQHLAVEHVLRYPAWRLSFQCHKWLQLP